MNVLHAVLVALAVSGPAADGAGSGSWRALVVGGINKDPAERQAKDRALAGAQRLLRAQMGAAPDRLITLASPDSGLLVRSGVSTADSVKKALQDMADVVEPNDVFVLYYAGQANIAGGQLRFNLPGPDVTAPWLGRGLGTIRARRVLIVLDCPGAALAAKALARAGRIIVCAAGAKQPSSTRLSDFFLPALQDAQSDVDGDGRVSVLEAFTLAAKQIEAWYREQEILPNETPCLEDDGDGVVCEQPWRYRTENTDGRAAAGFFLPGKVEETAHVP